MSEGEATDRAAVSRDELVAVARAVKTRGLRGELVADLLTDFPERFEGLERLGRHDGRTLLRLGAEGHWFQGADRP